MRRCSNAMSAPAQAATRIATRTFIEGLFATTPADKVAGTKTTPIREVAR